MPQTNTGVSLAARTSSRRGLAQTHRCERNQSSVGAAGTVHEVVSTSARVPPVAQFGVVVGVKGDDATSSQLGGDRRFP
jgi:hypothetical protein